MLEARIDRKDFASSGGVRHVLRDVVFRVAPGERVGLLGPSGTGKSTTLRILLGLDADFSGTVRHGAGRIGVMFQEPRLLPWLTVAANLRLMVSGDIPPLDVASLLERVQLPGVAGLYPRQLSLGMARRVSLARALAVSPALLVLDEPFASLDPLLSATLAGVVGRWASETGGGVLLATHDLAQAVDLASRVLVLAGAPATLAADVGIPPSADAGMRAGLRAELTARFGFLQAGGAGGGSTNTA